MTSFAVLPSIVRSSSPMKSEGAMTETSRDDGKTLASEGSRGSIITSENNNLLYSYEVTALDDDEHECCPICYELYVAPLYPMSYPIAGEESSGIATKSTHEEHFDDDTHSIEDTDDGSSQSEEVEVEINFDVENEHRLPHVQSSLSIWTESCQVQDEKKDLYRKRSKLSQNSAGARCHPREKVTIPGCNHEFCCTCLKDHCSYAISVRDIPIRCPQCLSNDSSSQCTVILPTRTVREALLREDSTNPDWAKFQRLKRMANDPSLVPCTRCDELISSKDLLRNNSDDPNRIHCPSCQHDFCRIHGDGHLGKNCTEASRFFDANDPSVLAILELCKPCSHCKVPIFKEEGCNHVVCPVCKEDMCFKCGTHIHLESKARAVRVCKNCSGSYFDHRKIWRHRLGILAKLPFMLPIYVGYLAMTFSLFVATCGCFCCLGCGVRFKETTKPKPKLKTRTNQDQKQEKSKTIVWVPLMAVREVLGWLLLPFIDFFRDCRFPCCFCHNGGGICSGRPIDDGESDDDDDKDHFCHNVDETYPMERDLENQIGEP